MSTSLKPIFDLLAKMNRNNKDRMIGNDILELQRQMKGIEKNLSDLFNNKIASGLEIERLKQEISRHKKALGIPTTPTFGQTQEVQAKPEAPKASFDGLWPGDGKK